MQVISQENYPLTKVSSRVYVRITFDSGWASLYSYEASNSREYVAALAAIIISLRKARKNYDGNGHDNNDNAMNDNNHRTRIDRFKGVEASLARKGKRLVVRDGNVEKTNGGFLPTPSALGWLYPADR